MPKRPNPFGDCSPLQFKTHIGTKEIDLGVRQDQNMRSVYDRTKGLLFQGSRGSLSPCKSEPMSDLTEVEDRTTNIPAQAMTGQLRIGSDGYLCGSTQNPLSSGGFQFQMQAPPLVGGGAMMAMDTGDSGMLNNNSVMMPYPPPAGQMTLDPSGRLSHKVSANPLTAGSCGFRICQSCNRPSNLRPRVCSFCEKITCSNCLQQCSNCEGLFCHVCSTINYDDCADKIYCLQCTN